MIDIFIRLFDDDPYLTRVSVGRNESVEAEGVEILAGDAPRFRLPVARLGRAPFAAGTAAAAACLFAVVAAVVVAFLGVAAVALLLLVVAGFPGLPGYTEYN